MRGYRFSDIGLAVEAWFLPLGAFLSVTLEVKQGSSTGVIRAHKEGSVPESFASKKCVGLVREFNTYLRVAFISLMCSREEEFGS